MKFMRSKQWSLLITYLKPYRIKMLLLFTLLSANIVIQIFSPLLLRAFIDNAQQKASLSLLLEIALFFILVATVAQIVSLLEAYVAGDIAWQATNMLRVDTALHCLHLDMNFHHTHTPGEMIERIDGDIGQLNDFFSRFIITIVTNTLLLVGTLVIIWVIDLRIGFALSIYTLITLIIIIVLRRFGKVPWGAARQSSADLISFLEERLSGTEDIRSSGAISYLLSRLYPLLRQRLITERRATAITMLIFGITTVLFGGGTAIALGLGGSYFKAGIISLGTIYLLFNYTQQLVQPLFQVSNNMSYFQQAAASIQRLQEILSLHSSVVDGSGMQLAELVGDALSVDFQHISFGYRKDEPVIKDVTFSVTAKQVLGIVGRTGSGKTTLARLLFRLYDPQQGTIRLSNIDIRTERLVNVRQSIGLVTQEVQLFDTTIRDNVTMFDESISDEAILAAFQELELWEWYQRLPQGLDTVLTAGGSGLSAGEAQLLTLTRIFLRNTRLIIMDEATSRIDPATEAFLERAMNRLLRDRTGIIIAHRLSTIQRVDALLVLEDGCIVEQGLRTDLLQDPESRFSQLLRTGQMEVFA